MARRCWINFQCRSVLLILIVAGQGPIAFAVGAGGSCLDISLIYLFSFLSPFLGDGPIKTEILSQRPVKPKSTNQPTLPVQQYKNNIHKLNYNSVYKTKSN